MLDLYKNIKSRRLELDMTQSELAKKLGYSDKSMIAKIEKGNVDLSQSKISAFAKALYTTEIDLMGWTNTVRSGSEDELEQDTFTSESEEPVEAKAGDKLSPAARDLIDLMRQLEPEHVKLLLETAKALLHRQ